MGKVIQFPERAADQDAEPDIDLMTAVDAAIRDLRDIAERCGEEARAQAEECRRMLERAFEAAS